MFTENHELAAKLEASAAHDWERFTTKHTRYPMSNQTELEQLQAALIAACMAWATARTAKEQGLAFRAFQNAAHAIKNAVGGTL